MKKTIVTIIGIMIALALCVGALAEEAKLPDMATFTAQTLDGKTVTQEALAQADLTVVNVWSIMCGPCIEEMPRLAAFAKALPENVRLMAICPDAELDAEAVQNFLKEAGFEGMTLVRGDGDFDALLSRVLYTPTTFFLDAQGHVVGETLIGGVDDLSGIYLKAVNDALTSLGKPVIGLEASAK